MSISRFSMAKIVCEVSLGTHSSSSIDFGVVWLEMALYK